jgi:hypothetical protein
MELALGIAAAIAASTLYSLGIALQALDARQAPSQEQLRVALLWRLVRRARWLAGTMLSILGWPLQVIALLLAPLVVVQPALACGLLTLMVLGEHILGERAGRYEYFAVCLIVLGVIGAALTAPEHTTSHADRLIVTLVLVGLGLASLAPYLLKALGHSIAEVTMIGAGLAFGWSGVATKLASDDITRGHWGVAAAWGLSTAAASGVGVLSEMSALQDRPAILVAPVVFVTQTVVPVILGPVLLGEDFGSTPLGGVPLTLALATIITGAAMLARSPLLLGLTAGAPVNVESDTDPSPLAASHDTIRSRPPSEDAAPSSTTTTSPARTVR